MVGSCTEYIISFVGETFFDMKWWDYSTLPLNINGRICAYYSIFWGFLALFLIKTIQPQIDKFIDFLIKKVSINTYKGCVNILSVLFLVNLLLTLFAYKMFFYRIACTNNIDIVGYTVSQAHNSILYNNEYIYNFANTVFSDIKMVKTFPNLKIQATDGRTILVSSLFKDIKPYYFCLFDKDKIESLFK